MPRMKLTDLLASKVGAAQQAQIMSQLKNDKYHPVDTVLPEVTKQPPLSALDQKPKRGRPSKRGVVVIVTIIRCGKNLLDNADNLPYSYKGLIDALAHTIGCDDGDRRIRWQFGQCETRGQTGTVVKIETV